MQHTTILLTHIHPLPNVFHRLLLFLNFEKIIKNLFENIDLLSLDSSDMVSQKCTFELYICQGKWFCSVLTNLFLPMANKPSDKRRKNILLCVSFSSVSHILAHWGLLTKFFASERLTNKSTIEIFFISRLKIWYYGLIRPDGATFAQGYKPTLKNPWCFTEWSEKLMVHNRKFLDFDRIQLKYCKYL